MSVPAPARIEALAHALRVTPQALLAAAAHLAFADSSDAAWRRAALAAAAGAPRTAERAVRLLATPIASYAQDDTDRALAGLWPARNG
jgi:hypothetical protein